MKLAEEFVSQNKIGQKSSKNKGLGKVSRYCLESKCRKISKIEANSKMPSSETLLETNINLELFLMMTN